MSWVDCWELYIENNNYLNISNVNNVNNINNVIVEDKKLDTDIFTPIIISTYESVDITQYESDQLI